MRYFAFSGLEYYRLAIDGVLECRSAGGQWWKHPHEYTSTQIDDFLARGLLTELNYNPFEGEQ